LTLRIQQRHWLLVWESTPQFERSERSANPLFLLIGGLLFTALLTLLLVVLTVRRTEHLEIMLGKRLFAAPLLVLAVLAAGAFALYSELLDKERHDIRRRLADEASETDARVHVRLNDRVDSIARMARRWEAAGGTPEALWRRDAGNYIDQIPGLRAMQWIDPSYHVRWVQPTVGNESAVGLDINSDAMRAQALRSAADRRDATIMPPLDLAQGYPTLIVYIPVRRDGKFDGFLAGIFEAQDFFSSALRVDQSRDFIVSVLHGGRSYFENSHNDTTRVAGWAEERTLRLAEQDWMLRIEPTAVFIDAQKSSLPALVLAAGLLVAALAALSVRYILISRLNSARLAKSSALNAGIISSSAHLVIAIDPQYRIMIFNRAAENALGYRAAEVIGMRAIPWFMLREELEQRARALSSELGEEVPVGPQIFTRIPLRDGKETREWHFVRKNGSRFPVSVIITPLRDEAGTLTGFLGVIEDVTARREMDRMKSEFTAVVSHELRTPLTSIRGSLGLILGALATSLPEKVKDLLEIAQTNCERLVLLVNDILDVEKFGAGQMRFDMRDAPLAAVLLQAVEANEGYARKFNARIEVAHVDAAWRVTTDPDRFIQVMSNLLSNAAKFSPPGGVVKVWAERAGGDVRILVRDHGPGIPDEFRGRVFEKFSQADSSATRKKGGTGLGLHIARQFVERMGGRIGFESEAGKGATFWIELPLVIEDKPGSGV
jgi:PAS domain S-box-containing protein